MVHCNAVCSVLDCNAVCRWATGRVPILVELLAWPMLEFLPKFPLRLLSSGEYSISIPPSSNRRESLRAMFLAKTHSLCWVERQFSCDSDIHLSSSPRIVDSERTRTCDSPCALQEIISILSPCRIVRIPGVVDVPTVAQLDVSAGCENRPAGLVII